MLSLVTYYTFPHVHCLKCLRPNGVTHVKSIQKHWQEKKNTPTCWMDCSSETIKQLQLQTWSLEIQERPFEILRDGWNSIVWTCCAPSSPFSIWPMGDPCSTSPNHKDLPLSQTLHIPNDGRLTISIKPEALWGQVNHPSSLQWFTDLQMIPDMTLITVLKTHYDHLLTHRTQWINRTLFWKPATQIVGIKEYYTQQQTKPQITYSPGIAK